jgi:ATP-dependent helicase/nuclease subunit B
MSFKRIWHQTEILAALDSGATLVTSGERLARAVRLAHGEARLAAGARVWERPAVFSYNAFLGELYERAFAAALAGNSAAPPRRLQEAAAEALWESCLRASTVGGDLLQPAATAREAHEAWKLSLQYRIPLEHIAAADDEDVQQFAAWAREFTTHTQAQRCLEDARLTDWLANELRHGRLQSPQQVIWAGFDQLTPQQQELAEALSARVLPLEAASATTGLRVNCSDERAELHGAAQWARALLEREPDARIGIVARDLQSCMTALAAELDDALCPGAASQDVVERPYNLSLGRPLASTPVVHAALSLLELLRRRMSFATASFLLRTPFLAGADVEQAARASLDLRLRDRVSETLTRRTLVQFATLSGRQPQLLKALRAVDELVKTLPARQKPSAWAASFAEALAACGWPGPRSLSSEEFQAVTAQQKLLAGWVQFDGVLGALSLNEALARLGRLAAESVFQPETADTPIQVLGLLETSGLCFDHLWIMGVSDSVWPESPRPRAFIPTKLQRQHGLPHASAALELRFAQTLTQRLLASAEDLVVSTPQKQADTLLRPSPLVIQLPLRELQTLPQADVIPYRQQLQQQHAAATETYIDERGPALATGAAQTGGTRLIRLQAACPFQAFAWQRLGAEPLSEPELGPDPLERGTLTHAALQFLWTRLESHAGLAALDAAQRTDLVERTAAQVVGERAGALPEVYTPRLAELERRRLRSLLLAWLEQELARPPFRVLECEAEHVLTLGLLKLRTRVDRIDESAEGGKLLLDYKTGRADVQDWLEPRPDEPQLPAYAVANRDGLAGLAFASLKPGSLGFLGLADRAGLAPGVTDYAARKRRLPGVDSWPQLLDWWDARLTALATEYAGGDARVAPKSIETCERCHLAMLCRIHTLDSAPLQTEGPGDGE